MSISEPFIRRPVATTLLMIGVALAGLLGYFQLPVAALPQVDYPTIVVSTTALALLFQAAGLDTLVRGLAGGALVGIGFVFPTMLSDAVFPGHIKTWWWINAAYRIVALLIIGGILGATAPESTLHKLERAASEAGSNVTNTLEVIGKSLGK